MAPLSSSRSWPLPQLPPSPQRFNSELLRLSIKKILKD
jgi:hypothetical protein